jgi:hypothetical protein
MLDIWDKARHADLTEESLVAYIDQMEAELDRSQQFNFLRWPILNKKVHQNPQALGSFQAEVENVRRFMKERLKWMDKRLGYTFVPTGITEVSAGSSESSIDLTQPYDVYSVSGQPSGHSLEGLRPGIYILRQGHATRKMIIR